jgi:hypothetical protein
MSAFPLGPKIAPRVIRDYCTCVHVWTGVRLGEEVKESMDCAQALAIVRSLANGVDPESGEVFAPDSAYQRPQVVRALYEAATALERIERFERRRQQMPPKTGEPWTEDEDRKLLAAFDAGRSLQELAAAHERTMGAVRARLLKYGRINA